MTDAAAAEPRTETLDVPGATLCYDVREPEEPGTEPLLLLIAALDAGPVDLFASSGGALNALALVARHPEQVRTLVAHEPPTAQVLPDRDAALAAALDVHETYLRDGTGPAFAVTLRRILDDD